MKPSTPPTLFMAMLPLGFVKNAATRVRALPLPLPLLDVSRDPSPLPTPPDPRPGTGEIEFEEGVPDPDELREEEKSLPRSTLPRPPDLWVRSLVGVDERLWSAPSRLRPGWSAAEARRRP